MKTVFSFFSIVCFIVATPAVTIEAQSPKTPILVELFTSEGCSSCPPADAWLQKLDTLQPVPGAQLIVLSEHVDYWNHDGWKDPYSSSLLTDRQNGYVQALGLSSAYTPQLIVNGKTELHLDDPKQVAQVFQNSASAPRTPVSVSSVAVKDSPHPVLVAQIKADGSGETHSSEIYAAVALDHAESQVLRGENGGRHLTHVAVVEELVKVGKLEKGKSFSQAIHIDLKPGMDAEKLRLIVFAQEPDYSRVTGAALQTIDDPAK